MRLFNDFSRMLLPPSQAAAQREDDIGMPTGRINYHRRSIFELGPKGNWFLFSAIQTSHLKLRKPYTGRIQDEESFTSDFGRDLGPIYSDSIGSIQPESMKKILTMTVIVSTSAKERFEMLKEVNLHRKHYNRKRSSNNSACRPNSFIGSGTIPAIPKLGNKTECTKLHFLIVSRSKFEKDSQAMNHS